MHFHSQRNRCARRSALFAAAILVGTTSVYAVVPPPPAVQNNWVGPINPSTGDYLNPANWSLGVVPSNADNHFATINNDGIAVVSADAQAAFLNLGTTYRAPGDVDKGTLNITAGTLTLGEFRVGGRESLKSLTGSTADPDPDLNDGGIGFVLQTGGTVNVNYTHGSSGDPAVNYEPPIQSLYVGDSGNDLKPTPGDNHAEGTYQINAGTLLAGLANDDAIVIGTGVGTKGTFIQQGGDVTSTGFVTVARRGAVASYTMSGGTLKSQGLVGLVVGDGESTGVQSTTGTFTQTGGTVTTSSDVRVSRRSGTGTYNMSGGALNIGTEVGAIGGSLIVGGASEGNVALMKGVGTFNLSGSSTISIGKSTDTSTANGNVNVGFTSGSLTGGSNAGTLNIADTSSITLNRPNAIMAVGNGRGAVGTVNQSGGTVTLTTNGATGTASMSVGRNNSSGTYNLSGTGVLNASTIAMESAAAEGTPVRQFNVSGGTLNAGVFNFGSAATNSVRSLNVSGGNVTIGTLTTGSTATTFVSGGTFNVTTSLVLSSTGTFRTAIPLTLATPVTLGNITIQVDSDTLHLSGPMSSGGRTVTKTGAGTLTVSGTQSHTAGAAFTNSAGGGTLNLNANGGTNVTVNANSGTTNFGASQTIRGIGVNGGTLDIGSFDASTSPNPVTLISGTINGTTGVITGASYAVQGGTANAILAGAGALTKTGVGTATLTRANTYTGGTTVSDGTLNVNNADALGGGSLTVTGGSAVALVSLPKAVTVSSVTTTGAGKLDLTNNAMVVKNSTLAAVQASITAGFNSGDWLGAGITSSSAATDAQGVTALGYLSNADLGLTTFEGVAVDADDILVKYTYYGDADLGGTVNLDDFNQFLFGFQDPTAAKTWLNGDFDFSNTINLDDFNQFLYGYQNQGAALGALSEAIAAADLSSDDRQFMQAAVAAVPEPAGLGLLAAGALGLLGRRRRVSRA